MTQLLRLLGAITLGASGIFAVSVLLAMAAANASERDGLSPWLEASLVVTCIGLLIGIVHLNWNASLSKADKDQWRTYFRWGGPIAAGLYLLRHVSTRQRQV